MVMNGYEVWVFSDITTLVLVLNGLFFFQLLFYCSIVDVSEFPLLA